MYIDLHCDTLTELSKNENFDVSEKNVTVHGLRQGNVLVQCCSMFVPTGRFPSDCRTECITKEVNRIYGNYTNAINQFSQDIMAVKALGDIERCEKEEKTGILLTIEDGGVLLGDEGILIDMYNKGVRLITLTWNHENEIGFPSSCDRHLMSRGLKDVGMRLMEKMCSLGIMVDVSHLSEGGFYDVYRYHNAIKKPFVASHSNARTLADNPRNLTDDAIKKLSDCGGVMGLNFYPPFLKTGLSGKDESKIYDMVNQLKYIRNAGGIDCIAIGTDFDGISGKLEIKGPQFMWRLWEELKKQGFTETEIEKIKYKNAIRVMKEILK